MVLKYWYVHTANTWYTSPSCYVWSYDLTVILHTSARRAKAWVWNIALKPRPKAEVLIAKVCTFYELLNWIIHRLKGACFKTQENIIYRIIKNIRALQSIINCCALLYCTTISYYGLQCVINMPLQYVIIHYKLYIGILNTG